ncbi:hypothetical protein ACLI1A_07125 [Flavobacterium sp. RHBU_3]|uniref:HD domain-containing protein n=1 Tax=Flavobacterium sp. RHBU_3 TaxID=3391184 RepID=UPI003984CCE1
MEVTNAFYNTVLKYSNNPATAQSFLVEIEKAYSKSSRHYHNLTHLQNLYSELLPVKDTIADWDTLLFAIIYHDAVYSASKKDNEEKSAHMAAERLQTIGYPEDKIALCHEMILATKQHSLSGNNDINLFTDADLSILGKPWPEYEAYCKNVRKEYRIYPDLLYKPGRKKALNHFLEMHTIFKTNPFKNKYEEIARQNIYQEIMFL